MRTCSPRSGYEDKSSYTVNQIFRKLFKEREICCGRNLEEKETTLKKIRHCTKKVTTRA